MEEPISNMKKKHAPPKGLKAKLRNKHQLSPSNPQTW